MEIKTWKIKARYRRQRKYYYIYKEVRDITLENALEKFFSEAGRLGIKRMDLTIEEIKEIKPEEINNPKLRSIALGDVETIVVE